MYPQAVLEVVLWLHEEEAVDAPYIQAVLAEFEAACEACSVPVPAKLRALSLEVALQQGSTSQVRCHPAAQAPLICWTTPLNALQSLPGQASQAGPSRPDLAVPYREYSGGECA